MSLKIVQFPEHYAALEMPEALRKLAEEIEKGLYDNAHNLVWAIDCGAGRVEVGYFGQSASRAPDAYFLMGLAQSRLTQGVLK